MSFIICVYLRSTTKHPSRHIFRTAQGSILTFSEAVNVATQLRVAYPKELYGVSITREYMTGEQIDWESGETPA